MLIAYTLLPTTTAVYLHISTLQVINRSILEGSLMPHIFRLAASRLPLPTLRIGRPPLLTLQKFLD